MLTLLFVNKPITVLFYLLGLCLMVFISFSDGDKFWFTSIWLVAAYSVFYCTSIIYYYLLRGDEKFEIRGVDIRTLKVMLKIYWFMCLVGLFIGLLIASKTSAVIFPAIFLLFYNAICAAILKCVILAKLFSLALKKNPTIKDINIDELYKEIRELLLKKVIC